MITLRQLLGHVCGLQREPDGAWWERTAGGDLAALLRRARPDKLAYPPHRALPLLQPGVRAARRGARALTGEDWATLVATRLLEPLGMQRTTYAPAEPFARGYVVHPWHGTLREEPRQDAGAMAPAGQLWSTVADLATWAAFLADPARTCSPRRRSPRCARPVVIGDPDVVDLGHGLGLRTVAARRAGLRRTHRIDARLPRRAGRAPPVRTGVVVFANAYTLHGGSIAALGQDLLAAVLDHEPGGHRGPGDRAPRRRPRSAPLRALVVDGPGVRGGAGRRDRGTRRHSARRARRCAVAVRGRGPRTAGAAAPE